MDAVEEAEEFLDRHRGKADMVMVEEDLQVVDYLQDQLL
jgi:hypothetical protein